MSYPIVLFDGVCGLCDRFVQFILRRDSSAIFRFAPLQSALAARLLTRHGITPHAVDTIYVVQDKNTQDETLLARSDAVLFILERLGGIWRPASKILRLMPRALRDFGYNMIARRRYRVFGRSEVCILPNTKYRDRFLNS